MSTVPVILLSACCQAGRTGPSSPYPTLVRDLLELTDEPPSSTSPNCAGLESLQCSAYPWRLSNKYYDADVEIITVPEPTLGSQELADAVEAVGLYFCGGQRRCFGVAKSWLAYLEHLEPEVKFLVCDRLSMTNDNGAVSRDEAVSWCVGNGFELIELANKDAAGAGNPESASAGSDDDCDNDDDDDHCGVARMRQALHSHTWPNLVLRQGRDEESQTMRLLREQIRAEQQQQLLTTERAGPPPPSGDGDESTNESEIANDVVTNASASSSTTSSAAPGFPTAATAAPVEEALLDRVYDDDDDGRRLDSLFARVMQAKSDADRLPVHSAERRELAARVIAGVWRELGMPEGELDNLDDEDSD